MFTYRPWASWSRTHRLALAFAAGALALSVSGCTRFSLPDVFSGVIEPTIAPVAEASGPMPVSHTFEFEGEPVTLKLSIDRAVYQGAVTAEKSTVFIGRDKPDDWISGHYRAFVEEEHQEPFYVALDDALAQVVEERALDSSRYVELVMAMVQTMEYRVDPGSLAPKFPIETLGDVYGDCDDKALLAAGVLARAGYDVALLFFEPEKHVALGVSAPGLDYKGTGYAYVEPTQPSLLGMAPAQLSGGVLLESQPDVVRIGVGTRVYESGAQAADIKRLAARLGEEIERMREQIASDTKRVEAERGELESARQDAEASTDPASAAQAIARYNALVRAHNDRIAAVNRKVGRYNELVAVDRYVIEHQTSRPQVHERLKAVGL